MSKRMSETERIKMISNFIKTNEQPEGYFIKECSDGYRIYKTVSELERLEALKARLIKQLANCEEKINKLKQVENMELVEP